MMLPKKLVFWDWLLDIRKVSYEEAKAVIGEGVEVSIIYTLQISPLRTTNEELAVLPIVHYGGPNKTFAKPVETFFEISIMPAPSLLEEHGFELG